MFGDISVIGLFAAALAAAAIVAALYWFVTSELGEYRAESSSEQRRSENQRRRQQILSAIAELESRARSEDPQQTAEWGVALDRIASMLKGQPTVTDLDAAEIRLSRLELQVVGNL